MRVLITGASGFLGGAAAAILGARFAVVRAYRALPSSQAGVAIGDIGPQTDWSRALEGVDVVVHLAGLAHAKHDQGDLQRVNVEGAANLVRQAKAAGVSRFIYMSSVKAAVDHSGDRPAREADPIAGLSPYGRSKREAERAVLAEEALRPVILRPPLVFAPDARANFAALLRLAASGMPLPFATIRNRRSLIARDTLVEAVGAVLARAGGPAGVFYVADQPAVSTPEILIALRAGLDLPPRLFSAPAAILRLAPRALTETLEVDDSAFRAAYGYGPTPRPDVREALRATAAAWKNRA